MLMAVQIASAGTTAEKASDHNQQQQQQVGQRPDQQEKLDEEPVTEEEPILEENEGPAIDQDSLEDDSVNKYNFIFYFLYKFKYDQE